ncbi:hypothetical protein V6N13_098392 [Hibiscus sabdariffa]|uniref:Uncharacterized protein n=1 Tax=Hibiscus sabdariffa TaxID=183260 RepID=A0ABR2EDN1_9ROSI
MGAPPPPKICPHRNLLKPIDVPLDYPPLARKKTHKQEDASAAKEEGTGPKLLKLAPTISPKELRTITPEDASPVAGLKVASKFALIVSTGGGCHFTLALAHDFPNLLQTVENFKQ